MKPADVCIAVLVAVISGLAFVASRIALDEFSPSLMAALRFSIAAVPCLFVRKPKVSWPLMIAISFTLFLGQFLSQAYGIAHGVLVGLLMICGTVGLSTSIAYWLWGRLLRDYPAAQVVPFALLVPFVGSAASSVVFSEKFGSLRLAGMVTVVGGIAVMPLSKRPRTLLKIA